MALALCPSRDELRDYLCGKLSDEASEALAEHLEGCSLCQAELASFPDSEDTLIARLKTPETADPYAVEPKYKEALARAKSLFAACGADGKPSPDASTTFFNRQLGEYQLLERLGRGGMGMVYKARQQKLDRVVALKILSHGRTGDAVAIVRFEREMKAIGRLDHPNIVQAYDAREIDGTLVLIMEFIDGLDLAEIVRRIGPLPTAEACEMIRRTAFALQCAHEHGLVHRDIKPSNIMLSRSGEVKLLDLGLARFFAESALPCATGVSPVPPAEETPNAEAAEDMTVTGQAMGTADYMAPEQASDSRTVDIRADIYSLGCTLYRLLSGRAPFGGPDHRGTLDKMNAHVRETPPPLGQFVPALPEGLEAILDRMLAKIPADRFSAPAEVAAALEPFCHNVGQVSNLSKDAGQVGIPSHEANLPELVTRAIALPREQWAKAEKSQDANFITPRPTTAPNRRRPIVRNLLLGAAFFGLMALAFAGGILITINREGKLPTTIEAPEGSKFKINELGDMTIDLAPGEHGDYVFIDLTGKEGKASLPPEPYKIAPGDYLLIRASFTLPDQPIDAVYRVEPRGTVPLPPAYGRAKIDGLSLVEAEAAITKQLSEVLKSPEVSVTLAGWKKRTPGAPPPEPHRIAPGDILNVMASFCLPDQPINGPHLVESDGQLTLGPAYGRVNVKGLTFEEAEKIALEKLAEVLRNPEASITLEGWRTDVKSWNSDRSKRETTESRSTSPSSEAQIKVFSLAYGDAESLGLAIQQILPTEDAAALAKALGKEKLAHPLKLSVDARTNHLIASGDPEVLAAVEALLQRLDVPNRKSTEKVSFRTAKITRGDVSSVVNATGTVEPEEVVDVCAQVSGKIVKVAVDYNSHVNEGDILAEIDNAAYRSRLDQELAGLERAKAELVQAETKAASARTELDSATEINKKTPNSIAAIDIRKLQGDYQAAAAAVSAAKPSVKQAEVAVQLAQRNLENTVIRSPIKGVVVMRRVNMGQNVTSEKGSSLFLIAKDSDKMKVWALVNEADIARLHEGMPASFTVDAYPNTTFKGTVTQIRLNAQSAQSVVLYTVVITFDNNDAKLLPYMTATVRFEIEKPQNVLLVPNAALRYEPIPESPSRPEHPPMVFVPRGTTPEGRQNFESLYVEVGVSDGKMTEVSGEKISEGMEVVIGDNRPAKPSENPFKPRDPFSMEESLRASSPAVADEQAIQGTWEVVSSTFALLRKLPGGKDVSADEVRKTTKVVITGDLLKVVGEHVTNLAFAYRLNPSAKTKMIDLKTGGEEWGLLTYGIYELKGDQLTICAAPMAPGVASNPTTGAEEPPDVRIRRPTDFWAELGSGKELLVLRRIGKAVVSEDEKNIQGTWKVEKCTSENNSLGFKVDCPMEITPDSLSSHIVIPGNQEYDYRFAYAIHSSATPKRIDIATMSSGFYPVHGIYELKGDELTIHWAFSPSVAGELPAPADFNSAGESVFSVTLKREPDKQRKSESTPASPIPSVNPAAELKALQGLWKVVRVEKGKDSSWNINGQNYDLAQVESLDFDNESCWLKTATGAGSKMACGVDSAATPKTIDLRGAAKKIPGEVQFTASGIYQVDGDQSKICLRRTLPWLKTDQRPTRFATDSDSIDCLFILRRPSLEELENRGTPLNPDGLPPEPAASLPASDKPEMAKSPAAEYKAMQGWWRVVRQEKGKDSQVPSARLVWLDHVSFEAMGMEWSEHMHRAYRIDPTASPKAIDLCAFNSVGEAGENKEWLGIYDFDGDHLKVCLSPYLRALTSDQRPKAFTVDPNSADALLVLEREPPSDDDKPLLGDWDVTSTIEDGQSVPLNFADEPKLHIAKIHFEKRKLIKWYGSKLTNATGGSFLVDTTQQPPRVTMFGHEWFYSNGVYRPGPSPMAGIYRIADDRLTIAYRDSGPAPEKFESTPGSGVTLLELKRGKPKPTDVIPPPTKTAPLPTQQTEAAKPASTAANPPQVYNGKTLPEWTHIAATELNADTQKEAFKALVMFDGPGIEAFQKIVKEGGTERKKTAIQTIESLRPEAKFGTPLREKVVRLLISLLENGDADFRYMAANDLDWYSRDSGPAGPSVGNINPLRQIIMPALLKAMEGEDDRVRGVALGSIHNSAHWDEWKQFGEQIVQAEINALDDTSPNNRRDALLNLGSFGFHAEKAVPKLIELVRGRWTDPAVRNVKEFSSELLKLGDPTDVKCHELLNAIYALGQIGPLANGAIPVFDEILTKIAADDKMIPGLKEPLKKAADESRKKIQAEKVEPPKPPADAPAPANSPRGAEKTRNAGESQKSAYLGGWQVTDETLASLKESPRLQSLSLANANISDAGLANVEGLTELESLDLTFTKITDAGLQHVRPLVKLRVLNLHGDNITDAGLEHLKGLTELENFDLTFTKITDAGLERLKAFPKLKALGLVGTHEITDAGLAHLQGLPELEGIDLRWSHQIGDAGLANLKGVPKLNWLVLWGTQVSDAGLEHLQTLQQLKSLELGRTKVTDAGLPKLEALKNLQSVGFGETPVSAGAKDKLRKALPSCKID
jgi:RND family efflux transporter MFP subunit